MSDKKISTVKAKRVPVGGVEMPNIPNMGGATPMSPEQMKKLEEEGRLIPGVGSAYAQNQHVPPPPPEQKEFVNPPRPEGGLREETIKQLEEVSEVVSSVGEEEDTNEYDIFDEFGQRVRNEIVNPERRKLIESRCDPLDLSDLLVHREIRQVVPIVPGKFEPTFRSLSGSEDLFLKKLIGEDNGADRYILDKFSMMNLCAGLFALNGKELPTHLNKNGLPDKELFNKKFEMLMQFPLTILSDLAVNFHWFDKRVRALLSVENIQNF